MGCDVVAVVRENEDAWDNYQCKHYDHPLSPSDIWLELGKIVYYSYTGAYDFPRHYYFVAPQGAGTTLAKLLRKPEALKARLKAEWARHVRDKLTATASVPLEGELALYLEGLDFSIFSAVSPLRIIDGHARTRWHAARFGGGLPPRPVPAEPPGIIVDKEAAYVRQLLAAYQDHAKAPITSVEDLGGHDSLRDHFGDARREFYSAESLRSFSRDTLPPGEFERLQADVESGIGDEVRATHQDAYHKVLAVVKTARTLQVSGHALLGRMSVRDRGGICHQLANEERVRWVK